MSYILDALQRADAERTRGGVPTLHARQASSLVTPARRDSRRPLWLALVAILAAVTVTIGVWRWYSPTPTDPTVAMPSTPSTTAPSQSVAGAPTNATSALPPTQTPIVPAATAHPVTPSPAMANTPVAPNVGLAPAVPAVAARVTHNAPPPPQTPKAQAGANTLAQAKVVVPPAPLAPLLSELPDTVRQQIPALAVTGAVYSDNPAQRLLLVNGQVLTQGSLVTPELTLVEIRSGSSEFRFRGTLFRVAH